MISVCIATYNGEKYIKEQLDSILAQLGTDDEVIVSDDFSIDKTVEIIENYHDNRIKIFLHKKNEKIAKMRAASFRFASENFENAIKHSKGEFIYLSDQDDIWVPGRIKRMQDALSKYDLTMCNCKVMDEKGNIVKERYYQENPISKWMLKNMLGTPFVGCCMAFRRDILSYCLPFPKVCIGQDYWIGYMVLRLGTFHYIDEPLHLYRVHSGNVSSPATGKSRNPFLFKISYRIVLICQVMSRSIGFRARNLKTKKNKKLS